MMNKRSIEPPRWARKILVWYCKPEILEDLEGDLHEYFIRNLSSRGRRTATLIYIVDVIKFFRIYTIRKPQFIQTLIHWVMLGSYIRTSGRNILRNKLFSFINVFGLSISMAVGLLLIAMIHDVYMYDRFHANHDRIYRLTTDHRYLGRKNENPFATTSLRAARAVRENVAGVEDLAIFRSTHTVDVTFGETTVPLSGLYADEGTFRVFSFRLLQGNPANALKDPFSIILTEQSAMKLFGEMDVMGKSVVLSNDKQYTVTGVLEDIPRFSHIRFEMLVSLSTRDALAENNADDNRWEHVWSTWAYVLVKPGADLNAIQQSLDKLAEAENKTVEHYAIFLSLFPMDGIMTGENQSNQMGPTVGRTVIQIFTGLAIVVVLSACFNYTNLSIARAFRRSREVGIRKTIGALKSHVLLQFIVESVIIALIALVVAFGLFLFLRPHYINIEDSFRSLLVLELSPSLIGWFVVFALGVGVFAGIFPALFFSRLNAIQVLKNVSAIPRLKGITIRKTLIVFQYTISIIAITVTMVMHKQYKHFVAFDLGFTTANVLNIPLHGNKPEILRKELLELPEVKAVSQSLLIQSLGSYHGTNIKNPLIPEDSGMAFFNFVDENYIPLHEYTLLAGRNFAPAVADSADEREVIVNEHVLKRYDIAEQDPHKAVGEVIKVDGKPMIIAGVIRNFQYGKADENRNNKEVLMRYAPKKANYLNVKIESQDWLETYARLEKIWKKIDPVHPFAPKFYDEQIEESFGGLKAAMKVGGFLAFLVIAIASIGLLGMVVFTTETRVREISIRKVFGASEGGLLILLSKGFVVLLFIAATIGLATSYVFFTQVMLPNIGNAAPVNLAELLIGVLSVVAFALALIAAHGLKVSRTNPAEVLKVE